MPYDLGVDLGTTSTAASLVRDGHLSVCRLGSTSYVVPSVVSIREDGTILTGESADRRSISDPSRTVREFKRRLGDETPYVIGGTPYGAEVLTGYLLRDVALAVAEVEGEPPHRIALSYPATWGAYKLELLADAVRIADVPDAVFVPEPVAAAIAYARSNPLPDGSALLVYDFGGGTFDAAVVRLGADGADVVGTPEGLARLGGIDFDLAVLGHIDEAIGGAASGLDTEQPESRAALARLRDDCRQAKEALSSDTEAEIPVVLPTVRTSVRITRAELEALVTPRLADTGAVMDRVVAGAGLGYDQLAGVLLVGGTSRMPLIADFVRGHAGMVPVRDVDPLLAIANGAALLAESGTPVASTTADAAGGGAEAEAEAEAAPIVVPLAERPDGDEPSAEPRNDGEPPPEVHDEGEPSPEAPDSGAPANDRRRLVLAGVALLVLLLIGGAALALTSGGDDGQDRAGVTTKTTAPQTTDPADATGTTGGGGSGSPSSSAPATLVGGEPVATTTPTTPYFDTLRTPSSVSCAGVVPPARAEVAVSWKALNADSVTLAIDSPDQTWESGLPVEGSTTYTVTCDGSKTSTKAIVTALGAGETGKTESVTIPITF